MRTIYIDAGPDGHRQAHIVGQPSIWTVLCFAAVAAAILAVLIVSFWPVP